MTNPEVGGFYAVGAGGGVGVMYLRRYEGVGRGEVVAEERRWGGGMGMGMGIGFFIVWVAVGEGW